MRRDGEAFLKLAPQVPVRTSTETFALEQANEALTRLVNDLIDAGAHGLTPLGSTGEFAYLNRVFAHYNLAACIKGGLELQGYEVGAPLL